ncbi:MAG: SAM-dependent methyltransferase [Clostridia bacterium]|nr:SAM-dependent methyltransferase [Clostridia bacterium]
MLTDFTPDARLCSAIPYLTRGARIADVGTDHAYLPIYLVREGIASCALACDVNRGPIDSARANIAAAGLSDRIDTLQTDGLHGVESFSPDHILIFGMGGELILRILSEAPWVRDARIGLVLQPMSRAHLLRAWLLENGFAITGETISFADKYYQTLSARYCGTCETYTKEELLLGKWNVENPSPLLLGFLEHEIGVYEAILRGKARATAADSRAEEEILQILKTRLESIK